jgi:hypothetical protein
LTGLPNRALLHDRLTHAIAAERRDHGLVATMFIDVDRFQDDQRLARSPRRRRAAEADGRPPRGCVREDDTVRGPAATSS